MKIKEITLSANTLFHFTNEMENLEGILSNDFFPRYSLEYNISVPDEVDIGERRERALAMVSFCDIPLSQVKNHARYYGPYAIGLSKEWGIKNKITPVLYTHKNSFTAELLYNGLRKVIKIKGKEAVVPKWNAMSKLVNFLGFVKLYEGRLWRKNGYLDETIRFYDEREWRYIPNLRKDIRGNEDRPTFSISKEDFIDANKRRAYNKQLEGFKLSFEPKDIKYVIVKEEDERLKMAESIKRIKGRFGYDDVQTLITRIISMEQIIDDF